MKKSKRPFELEESDLDPSKDTGNGLELEGDDEIIELEDMLPNQSDQGSAGDTYDEDLDYAELLDAESGAKIDVMSMEDDSSEEDILDEDVLTEDLFKEFSFGDKIDANLQDTIGGEKLGETGRELEEQLDFDEDIFAKFRDEPLRPSPEESRGEVLPLFPGAESEKQDEAAPALEGFVSQIESRLLDAVRQIVEARLPDIVRTVLHEEIEKMKKESIG
jgi:hypothetical protein